MANMLDILKERFDANPSRHDGVTWEEVEDALRRHPKPWPPSRPWKRPAASPAS